MVDQAARLAGAEYDLRIAREDVQRLQVHLRSPVGSMPGHIHVQGLLGSCSETYIRAHTGSGQAGRVKRLLPPTALHGCLWQVSAQV